MSKKTFFHCLPVMLILLSIFLLAGCGNSSEKKDSAQECTTEAAGASTAASTSSTTLADGEYEVEFKTDSSMFHVNEACNGMGTLTVKDGQMTVHVSLVSEKIVNLFVGKAEDAQKDGAELLEPTTDTVTYSDGTSEEVFGFDIPVASLDEDFDLAILGEKGKWYDHVVSVASPQ